MSTSVKRELISGFIINFIAKYSNVIIQFVIGAILARILTPKEFGIVAIVMVFVAFFNLLAYMGIGPAIIQHRSLDKDDINHIFAGTVIFGTVIALVFLLSAPLVAAFFNDEVYVGITRLLSISILFFSLSIIPKAMASKKKRFKLIGIIDVSVNTVIGVATIMMALGGFSYYAIVIKSILTSIASFAVYYFFADIEIHKVHVSKIISAVKKVLEFSVFQSLFDVINYFSRNMDNLLIGKFLGDVQLGYYDIAYKLMLYPITNFTHVLTPVMLPILKDYQDDRQKVYDYYKQIVKVLAVVGTMASVMLFFTAEEVIVLVYGEQWLRSVTVFRLLAISIGIQMVVSSSGSIYQVLGDTKALFISGTIGAVLMTSAFTIGIIYGSIEGVAVGFVIGFTINFFIAYYILIVRVFRFSLFNFLLTFKDAVIIGIIMVGILLFTYVIRVDSPIVSFGFKCLLGLVGVGLGLLVSGSYKDMLKLVKR